MVISWPCGISWKVPRVHWTNAVATVATAQLPFFEMKCAVMQRLAILITVPQKRKSLPRMSVLQVSPGQKPLELEAFARHRRSPASKPDWGRLNSVQSALRALRLEHHHFVRNHILPILSWVFCKCNPKIQITSIWLWRSFGTLQIPVCRCMQNVDVWKCLYPLFMAISNQENAWKWWQLPVDLGLL